MLVRVRASPKSRRTFWYESLTQNFVYVIECSERQSIFHSAAEMIAFLLEPVCVCVCVCVCVYVIDRWAC